MSLNQATENTENTEGNEPFDQVIASRLGRLRSMPVDTSRLDRMIQAQIPRPVTQMRWFKPMRLAIAASLLIVIGVVTVFELY